MTLPMLTAELPGSDTATTLRQMKRKPEDFELVQQVSQLGRGSFGAVKLVKDRSNGTLFAMKIVMIASAMLDEQEGDLRVLFS
jgi:hypothetical protein